MKEKNMALSAKDNAIKEVTIQGVFRETPKGLVLDGRYPIKVVAVKAVNPDSQYQ